MQTIQYIPIITTLFALYFFIQIYSHYKSKPGATYLLWWVIGVATYGAGTLTESIHTLAGWSDVNFKAWYILGALLGGAPLAQGTVHLLMSKRFAKISTYALVAIIILAAALVIASPVNREVAEIGRLTGEALVWQDVRAITPFINIYAFIFLFGGAVYSAWKYFLRDKTDKRMLGNVFIAIGALLPGIGGSFTRFGHVEVLYVTELLGLLCIYAGYMIIKKGGSSSLHQRQVEVEEGITEMK